MFRVWGEYVYGPGDSAFCSTPAPLGPATPSVPYGYLEHVTNSPYEWTARLSAAWWATNRRLWGYSAKATVYEYGRALFTSVSC